MNILSFVPNLTSSATRGRPQYALRIGAFIKRELEVVSFEGHEKLSTPYVYDVVFASSVPVELLQAGAFGFPACLSIEVPGHPPRVIQGIAVGLEAIGAAESELKTKTRRYLARIVPRLWLLNHNRKYRVFQNQSAIQIACAVLEDAGIAPDIRLPQSEYRPIPFMYQRGETDLEFLQHVLAVAGVFYYFEHASGLLDDLMPGAGELGALAGGLGGLAGGAASLSGGASLDAGGSSLNANFLGGLGGTAAGAIGGVAGAVGSAASSLGAATTMVLCDRAKHTHSLDDSAGGILGGAASAGLGALGGALGGAAGAITGAIGDVVGELTDAFGAGIPYDGNGQAATEAERIFSFRALSEVRPKKVTLRDWSLVEGTAARDEDTSASVMFDGNAAMSDAVVGFAGGGGFASVAGSLAADLSVDALPIAMQDASVTEYGGDTAFLNRGSRDSFAERALSQLRSDRITTSGQSDCRRLAPGYRFKLARHPIAPVNTDYVVTGVRSSGYAPDHLPEGCPDLYRNAFECVPASIDPRPKKPAQRPPLGPEPAVVVGPVYGDVNCDTIGRIQVRFRWADASTSTAQNAPGTCWAHWLERWGGDGYGTQTLPRVGTEVLVEFHAGGEPIAVGQIHSRAIAPAFSLPREATKVGIRTRTIPNGGESEISIDDNPYSERVLVRASGNFATRVGRNTSSELSGTYDLTVGGERRESTNGDATLKFAKDVVVGVRGDLREEVGNDRLEIVQGSVNQQVEGDASRSVVGRVENVTHGAYSHVFGADSVERHLGHHAVVVAASDAGQASAVLHVEGAARAYAKGAIEAVSLDGFTLTCGDSHITIRKDSVTIASPTITLVGKTVQVTATDTAAVAAKTATVAGSDSVTVSGANKATLAGQSASVVLDSNATVAGSKVKLGSADGGPSSHAAKSKTTRITKVTLADADGNPIANQRVIFRKGGDGGPERVVVLDASGKIALEGDDALDVFFPECALTNDPQVVSEMHPYIVRQGDTLTLLASRYGFDADAVWNHEKNERLQKAGRDANILQPGDVLYIPEAKRSFHALKMGEANSYVAATTTVSLSLTFQERTGKPVANAACLYSGLLGGKDEPPTSTDGSGALQLLVSTRQPPFVVAFPNANLRFTVLVGHMDPVTENSGVLKRLGHLGYGASPIVDYAVTQGLADYTDGTRAAFVGAFQIANGQPPTGLLDKDTLDALVQAHGV